MGSIRPPDPTPDRSPASEVPPAITDALDALARHRAAAARHDEAMHETFVALFSVSADRARSAGAAERADRVIDRHEGARARDDARREREAEGTARLALRRAVERYARDLRQAGVPPERMIVAVKSVVRRAAVDRSPLPEPEHLIPDLVQWSVAAYFAAD